ncbi:hypothetical protein T484DRAFT_2337873 [Baffinella frigidus]|nr:hypothetical protein T484DRAFT_2337873 [Cryptophyta sp. CCMP2293]
MLSRQDGGAPAASGATWEHRPAIVSLLQRSSHAYYHFFGEALPKLYLLAQDLEHSNAVLLTDTSFGNTWTVEFLHLLGVPRDRLLNRVPGKVYLADTIYSSRPTPLHRPYPALLCRVRAALLGAALPRPHGGAYSDGEVREMGSDARRIVVVQRTGANNQHSLQHAACRATKGGCRVREVVNMEELILGLRSAFPAREISTFDSLGLTLLQQVRLFAGAEAVVGAHGAGLSNAAMCAPGGVVLELLPQMLQRASVVSIFWHGNL